jgi:hypothetical protein
MIVKTIVAEKSKTSNVSNSIVTRAMQSMAYPLA